MSHSTKTDFVQRFLFEALDIRGAVVKLSDTWQAIHGGRNYPERVRDLLGELSAIAILVSSNLKQASRLGFQVRGHGPVSLLVVDCNDELGLRGMARHTEDIDQGSIAELIGDGQLVLTLDNILVREPYQSIVPLQGDTIGKIFEHYLSQSEQQPAHIFLAANSHHAVGLFLQKLPGADERDPDGWDRVVQLAATITSQELEQLPVEDLLTRLFSEEDIRLFNQRSVHYNCPEDWNKVYEMLRSLGRDEVESILREQGEIVIHDDICNRTYRLDATALDELFPPEPPEAHTLH